MGFRCQASAVTPLSIAKGSTRHFPNTERSSGRSCVTVNPACAQASGSTPSAGAGVPLAKARWCAAVRQSIYCLPCRLLVPHHWTAQGRAAERCCTQCRTLDCLIQPDKHSTVSLAGFWFHTIGQRKGVPLSGGPWYVVRKDIDANAVYISREYHAPGRLRNGFR